MDLAADEFKKRFPNLAKELDKGKMFIRIPSAKTGTNDEGKKPETLNGYSPDVIAFIRRCDNSEEAEEIIDFLEKRCEISHEYAAKLRTSLRGKGLRSFGTKKETGHYFKQGKA